MTRILRNTRTLSGVVLLSILCFSFVAHSESEQPCQKKLRLWNTPDIITQVPGYKIPGGIVLHSSGKIKKDPRDPPGTIFLTGLFFKESMLEVPKTAKPYNLFTYRYFPPTARENFRGAGRDHLTHQKSDIREIRARTVKGTGPNEKYSSLNGVFSITNFRTNGLYPLGEALLDQIQAINFEKAGFPIVAMDDFTLLPEELQHWQISDSALTLETQMARLDPYGRESLGIGTPSRSEIFNFVSSFYLFNAAHGALNKENLNRHAQLLDLGHTTFGYPIISGARRCTLCEGTRGALDHDVGVGAIDYFFSHTTEDHPTAFEYKLTRSDTQRLIKEIVDRVSDPQKISEDFEISKGEAISLRKVFDEKLELKAGPRRLYKAVRAFAKDLYGKNYPNYSPMNRELVYSLRFFMQIAALKKHLDPVAYRRLKLKMVFFAKDLGQEDVNTVLNLFERLFDSRASVRSLSLLFTEYFPASVVEQEIETNLKNQKFEAVPKVVKGLITDLTTPIQLEPSKFAEFIGDFFDQFKRDLPKEINELAAFDGMDYVGVQAILNGETLKPLISGRFASLAGLLKSKYRPKIESLIQSQGGDQPLYSNSEIARSLSLAIASNRAETFLDLHDLWSRRKSINSESPSFRTFSTLRDFYEAKSAKASILDAATEWVARKDVSSLQKADLLLSMVGVSARVFKDLESNIPKDQLPSVWAEIGNRGHLALFVELAKSQGLEDYLLDNASVESFLFADSSRDKEYPNIDFCLTDVTQLQYALVMMQSPSEFTMSSQTLKLKQGGKFVTVQVDPNRPVESFSTENALKYHKILSRLAGRTYRLPNYNEWTAKTMPHLHFIRAVRGRSRWNRYAWTYFNAGEITHPVAELQADRNGLYDTLGNVRKCLLPTPNAFDYALTTGIAFDSDPSMFFGQHLPGAIVTRGMRTILLKDR